MEGWVAEQVVLHLQSQVHTCLASPPGMREAVLPAVSQSVVPECVDRVPVGCQLQKYK